MTPDLQTAKKIAIDHCAAWTAKSADVVAARYSEVTSFGMNGNDPMTNRNEISQMAAGFMKEFPDLVLTCDNVLVADHHMVYAWTFVGHHVDSGVRVEFSGWEEWDLNAELEVSKSLGWYDVEDYERQVSGLA